MRSRVLLGLAWLVGTVASALVVWEGLRYEPDADRLGGGSVAAASDSTAVRSGAASSTSGTSLTGSTSAGDGSPGAVGSGGPGGPAGGGSTTVPVSISQVDTFTPGPTAGGSGGITATGGTLGGDGGPPPVPTPATAPTTAPLPAPAAPAPTAAPATPAPAPAPAPASEATFALVGGVAGVRFSAAGVEVLWATPNTGFSVEIEPEGQGRKVEFRSGGHRSRLDVWWQDGPRHTISERAD
ncbi:MAG: hypothetical protein R2749_28940 [Acidimicrobiales bacterium]